MKKRFFVAINLPKDLKEKIDTFYQTFLAGLSLRKTLLNNLHLTLIFLGDLNKTQETKLKEILKETLAEANSFKLTISGMGVFPDMHRARVVWLGSSDHALNQINLLLYRKLSQANFKLDGRPYTPHLTLSRIKQRDQTIKTTLPLIISEHKSEKFGIFIVNSIDLMESVLTKTGPKYSIVESYKLK
jgi:2'-5' RNA ligase